MSATAILDDLLSSQTSGPVIDLPSGLKVKLKRKRTIQLLNFVRLLSEGMGGNLAQLIAVAEADESADMEEFGQQVLIMVFMVLPNVPEFTVEWIREMVEPGLPEYDAEKFYKYFGDPKHDDTIAIVTALFKQEKDEIARLGKEFRDLIMALNKQMEAKAETNVVPLLPETTEPEDGQNS